MNTIFFSNVMISYIILNWTSAKNHITGYNYSLACVRKCRTKFELCEKRLPHTSQE